MTREDKLWLTKLASWIVSTIVYALSHEARYILSFRQKADERKQELLEIVDGIPGR